METEIREMLRQKAGEAFAPATLPVSTATRAKRRRAVTSAGLGVGLAAAIVAIIAGVGAITGNQAINYDDQPLKAKRTLAVPIASAPHELVTGFGSVWTAADEQIIRIDPRSGKVVAGIELMGPERSSGGTTERDIYTVEVLAAGDDALWAVGRIASMGFIATAAPVPPGEFPTAPPQGAFTLEAQPLSPEPSSGGPRQTPSRTGGSRFVDTYSLLRINPDDNSWKAVAEFEASAGSPRYLAAGEGRVWVISEEEPLSGLLRRFSSSGKLLAQTEITGSPMGIAVQGGSVWVPVNPGRDGKQLLRIDPKTSKVKQELAITGAKFVRAIAAADDDVWVSGGTVDAETGPFFLARINAPAGEVLGVIEVDENLAHLAAGGGFLWGVSQEPGRPLVRIQGNELAGTFKVDGSPVGITIEGARLWLAGVPEEMQVTRYEF